MPRLRKNRPAVDVPLPADLTQEILGKGAPEADGGGIANDGDISTEDVRAVGAFTKDAALKNATNRETLNRKRRGEKHVPWNEGNAAHLFDNMMEASVDPSSITAYVREIEPNSVDWPAIRCAAFRTGEAFMNHLFRNVHRKRGQATYEVQFKDASGNNFRGTGRLTFPSTLDDADQGQPMNHQGPPPGYPPPPWGYPPPPYGAQPYPPPNPYAPQGFGAPPGYPPQAPPAQAAPPAAPVPTPQAPPSPPPAQGGPQSPPQGYQDPQIAELRAMIQMQQLQLAQVLGAAEEFKRYPQPPPPQAPPAAAPPAQAAPPVYAAPQGLGAPPPQELIPVYDASGRCVEYRQAPPARQPPPQAPPQYVAPPPQGVGAAPPPAAAPAAAPPRDLMHEIQAAVGLVSGLRKTLESAQATFGGGGGGSGGFAGPGADDGFDDPIPAPPPEAPPARKTTVFGDGPGATRLVTFNDDKLDLWGSLFANADKIKDVAATIVEAGKTIQRNRPITAQGFPVSQPQQVAPQIQPRVVAPPAPRPPPAPPPSYVPDLFGGSK
jgi:hypothetical protein